MHLEWFTEKLTTLDIPASLANPTALFLFFAGVLVFAVLAHMLVRKTLIRFVTSWTQNTKYQWDDILVEHKFFTKICWFVPLSIVLVAVDAAIPPNSSLYLLLRRILLTGLVVVSVISLNALLNSTREIDLRLRRIKRSTLQGYIDAGKIISYIFAIIFIISILTGKSPWGILSILGGLTAVTMLVFKDSILGFVASLQLSSADMIRLGDWIEMSQYGADGDVISMSIHSVRVQNWDKTITTIPTYALVSSSFKNWRGMTESGGRRIKRAIFIDLHSIHFCSTELLEKLGRIDILKEYLGSKGKEIAEHNKCFASDNTYVLNGRRQTNIGIFRAYIIAYLKRNENIHGSMTFLVRQLAPTDHGLPLEIYVFSKDQIWANYEAIQADIFDHLLAAAAEFDLRIFQIPSGYDLRAFAQALE